MKEGFRQAMAWLHTWIGLLFGWLLFAIFLTGTMSYFDAEISHWSQPEIPLRPLDSGASVELAQGYLQQHASAASRWFISLPDERAPALSVMWQNPGKPGERGAFVRKLLDPQTGAEVQARKSLGGEFFYRFHFQLQMPYPWGRWLSTAAAMVMFVALISGIIIHKKIFKEFFTFRPRKGQRSWLDGHNALGVLILPFHLMITYSSLVIFMSMVMPVSILTSYGKDTQAFFNDLFPAANVAKAAGSPATLAPLRPMLAVASEQWQGGRVGRLVVNNPGDANASVSFYRHGGDRIVHTPGTGLLFNGVTGALESESALRAAPLVIAGGFYGLHMGHFAGPLLRWLYFLCGIGGTAMIGTGLVMWLKKRSLKHAQSGVLPFELKLVQVLNIASMSGLMIAVASFFWANRLLSTGFAERSGWEVNVFFISWGVTLLHALVRPGRSAWREQLGLGAVLFAGIPVINALTSDYGLMVSIPQGDWAMAGVDLTSLAVGVFLGWAAYRIHRVEPFASKLAPTGNPRTRGSELAREGVIPVQREVH